VPQAEHRVVGHVTVRAVVDGFVHRGEADIGEAGGGEDALRVGGIGEGERFQITVRWGGRGRPASA